MNVGQEPARPVPVLAVAPIEQKLDLPLRDYWLERVAGHTQDSYAGIPLAKFPEDLRVYEHLLWAQRPNVVIEIGTRHGGSALWFRDRLRTLASYGGDAGLRVIGIDLDQGAARANLAAVDPGWEETIELLEGDVGDSRLPDLVRERLPAAARCMVVEDSGHTHATTTAALEGFAGFVAPGGFLVVEDGCVDIEAMRLEHDWPRGVMPAVEEWLRTPAGARFELRRDLELYGVSCHPRGFLRRRPEPAR
jgi:cephalosporin hydroxylase